MYADLHCDTFYKCYTQNISFNHPSLHITQGLLKSKLPAIQTFAHYIPENVRDKYTYFQRMLENSLDIIHNSDSIVLYKNSDDILKAEKEGKILAILSVENGDFFTDDFTHNTRIADFLEANHIKFLSLCYNNGSSLCGGALTDGDITLTGKKTCDLLASRSVIMDLSHLNNKSASGVLSLGVKAVATHSNCFLLCNHPRNLTDENITRLCESGGLIGINLYSPFLRKGGKATLTDVKAHIDRIISLGGQNSITLGADFDGCDELPYGINSLSDISELYSLSEGLDEIFYNNLKKYLIKED